MNIILTRQYGDERVTKSLVRVEDEAGKVLMECEAREPRFADYEEAFPGCAKYCLAVGTYECKVKATELSPMTVIVPRSPGHRSTRIGWDPWKQTSMNTILLGMADESTLALEYQKIKLQQETFQKFEELVYRAYVNEEGIRLTVVPQPPSSTQSLGACGKNGEEDPPQLIRPHKEHFARSLPEL